MDKVITKMLNYFQEVLVELNTPKEMDASFLESLPEILRNSYLRSHTERLRDDIPPTFLIVEQTEFSAYHTRNNNFLGCWMVRLTSIEVFTSNPYTIEQEINGMYYSHGFGEFSIHKNGEIVRVDGR